MGGKEEGAGGSPALLLANMMMEACSLQVPVCRWKELGASLCAACAPSRSLIRNMVLEAYSLQRPQFSDEVMTVQ